MVKSRKTDLGLELKYFLGGMLLFRNEENCTLGEMRKAMMW